jgi:hypothetical protein
MHAGFQTGGTFTSIFFWVYLAVFASGLFGLLMQQVLPRLLLHDIPQETLVTQIPSILQQFIDDGEHLLAQMRGHEHKVELPAVMTPSNASLPIRNIGSPRLVGTMREKVLAFENITVDAQNLPILESSWKNHVRPYLEQHSAKSSLLQTGERAILFFNDLQTRVSESAQPVVATWETWCEKRRQWARQLTLHNWLHGWLAIHLPLSIALMLLLIVHVVVSFRYGLTPN